MVNSCSAIGCTNRYAKGAQISFYRFPTEEDHRNRWIRATKRKNWTPSRTAVICSEHFQTGRPSQDMNHPDFIPNVFVFNKSKIRSAELYARRKENLQRRNTLQEVTNNNVDMETINDVHNSRTEAISVTDVCSNSEYFTETDLLAENKRLVEENKRYVEENKRLIMENKKLCDENHTLKMEIALMKKDSINTAFEMSNLRDNLTLLKKKTLQPNFASHILSDKRRLKFYTGLKTSNLAWILSVTGMYVTTTFDIPQESQILIIFIKLKLNLLDEDIADRFSVSRRTVERIFKAWLPILASRLKKLIFWPSRNHLRKTLPTCFKKSKYKDTICIIDCSEIFTQKPFNLKTRSQMWSTYKHHQTIKILVAITPRGMISFVSECWGGKVSDKEITLQSGILKHLKSGDVVLADRGFTLARQFHLQGIKLVVPSYTRGKKQLSYSEVVESKRVSNVRIHVERVIGYLKKWHILKCILPITYLKYLDCILYICAGVHNLNPRVV